MHDHEFEQFEEMPRFRGDQQAPSRVPVGDPRQAGRPERDDAARGKGVPREAGPQRPVPVRLGPPLARIAACAAAGFDGAMRNEYYR